MSINPYEASSQPEVEVDWKDVIEFNGVVDEEHFRKLIPKRQLRLFAALGSLFLGVGGSILLASFVVATFFSRDPVAAFLSLGVLTIVVFASIYCFRSSSSAICARYTLKKFPDLLGPMSGSFSELGLMLWDGEKTHWFPWVLLSRMILSKEGVRVALGADPRRFLALSEEFFEPNYQAYLKQMKVRFQAKSVPQEQLKGECARAFGKEVGSSSYFQGWMQSKLPLEKWGELLLPPVSSVLLVVVLAINGQGSWLSISACVFLVIISLSSLKQIGTLLRARNLVSEAIWGWLDDKHFIQGSGYHCVQYARSSAVRIESDEEWIMMSLPGGSQYVFFRTFFSDKEYFDKIRSEIDTLAAT